MKGLYLLHISHEKIYMSFFKGVLVVLRETHSKMHYLKYFILIMEMLFCTT